MGDVLLVKYKTPEDQERVRIIPDFPDFIRSIELDEIKNEIFVVNTVINKTLSEEVYFFQDDALQIGMNLPNFIAQLSRTSLKTALEHISPVVLTRCAEALVALSKFYQWPDLYDLDAENIIQAEVVDDELLDIEEGEVYVNGALWGRLEGY